MPKTKPSAPSQPRIGKASALSERIKAWAREKVRARKKAARKEEK